MCSKLLPCKGVSVWQQSWGEWLRQIQLQLLFLAVSNQDNELCYYVQANVRHQQKKNYGQQLVINKAVLAIYSFLAKLSVLLSDRVSRRLTMAQKLNSKKRGILKALQKTRLRRSKSRGGVTIAWNMKIIRIWICQLAKRCWSYWIRVCCNLIPLRKNFKKMVAWEFREFLLLKFI